MIKIIRFKIKQLFYELKKSYLLLFHNTFLTHIHWCLCMILFYGILIKFTLNFLIYFLIICNIDIFWSTVPVDRSPIFDSDSIPWCRPHQTLIKGRVRTLLGHELLLRWATILYGSNLIRTRDGSFPKITEIRNRNCDEFLNFENRKNR